MTEHTMTEAVHDLVHAWTDVVPTGSRTGLTAVDHEPLLTMLRTAIRSSSGRTASGRSDDSARNPLNIEAFELWEQITRDVLMATRKHTRDNPNPMLAMAVQSLAGKVDALWANHQILEHEYQALIRKAHTWRAKIWQLFHKPTERELEFCPACEQSKYINNDGEISAALVAFQIDGEQPYAKCRSCGVVWQGEAQLLILGRMLGATMDTETLRDMGYDIEEEARTQ